jgi:hypothetical protein
MSESRSFAPARAGTLLLRRVTALLILLMLILFGCAPKATPELIAKGKALTPQVCTRCHPISKVRGHTDTRSGWYRVTDRMKGHGAQFSADEQDAITAYLAETQPAK